MATSLAHGLFSKPARILWPCAMCGCSLTIISYFAACLALGASPFFSVPVQLLSWPGFQTVPLPQILTTERVWSGGVWGGYWRAETAPSVQEHRGNRKDPQVAAFLEHWGGSCYDFAAKVPQPFTPDYLPRKSGPSALPGGAPRAWFQWEGDITWQDFQAAESVVNLASARKKRIIKYKVINNQLYRHGGCVSSLYSQFAEEMMLVALHLFKVPDTDLALQFSDTCPFPGMPAIAWGVCRNNTKRGGFTMPSYRTWQHALGPHQLSVLHSCFAERYPTDMATRIPSAIWRGSTTDPLIDEFNASNFLQAARVKLHFKSANSSVLDARLTTLLHTTKDVAHQLQPQLAKEIPSEDAMKHAIILDADGNGWSDRFHNLAHYNTPILKQASNYTGFFEHLASPGHTLYHFANDVRDVEEKAKHILDLAHTPEGARDLLDQVARRQDISAAMLNQVAVAEAMAYTMTVYAEKITWKVGSSLAYHRVPWTACCRLNPSLPEELVRQMHSRPRAPSMTELRAAGMPPGPEGDATQPLHKRLATSMEEVRHRTFYPYLWDSFWATVSRAKNLARPA